MERPIQILLIEDKPADATLIQEFLSAAAPQLFEVHHVERLAEGREWLTNGDCDLVLLDLTLPDSQGLETFSVLNMDVPEIPIIVLSGLEDQDVAVEAVRAGAQDYLVKGSFTDALLARAIQYAIERKEYQVSLRRSERRYRGLFNGVPVPLYRTTAEGHILDVNDPMVEMLQYPDRETLLSVMASELYVNAEDRKIWMDLMEREGTVRDFETRLRRYDGTTVWVLDDAHSVRDADGNLCYYEGGLRDVTERKRAEKALRERRDYYQAIIDGLHDEVIVVDAEYRICDVNEVFLRERGYRREDIIGERCYEVVSGSDAPCCPEGQPCPVQEVWREAQPARGTRPYLDEEETVSWVDVAASPLRDQEGSVNRVIVAYRDVTAERELEERLDGVHTLGKALVLTRGKRQIAQVTVDAARLLSRSFAAELWLLRDDVLECCAVTPGSDAMVGDELDADVDERMAAEVVRSRGAIYSPDVRDESRFTILSPTGNSLFCVPLTVKEKAIGVLSMWGQRRDAFNEMDRQLIWALSSYTALALENARLYQEASQRLARTEVLQEVMLASSSTLDFDEVLSQAIQALQEALEIDYLGFALPEEDRECLRLHPSHAPSGGLPDTSEMCLPYDYSVVGRAYTTGDSIWVPDLDDPPFECRQRVPGLEEEIAVPVKVRDRVVAVLDVGSHYPSSFDGDDLQLFEAIAAQLSVVMHNVELYEAEREQRRLVEESQAQLVQSEKLAATGRLAASLAHEINNPLQAIHNSLQIMLSFPLEPSEEREYLEMADEDVQRLIDMVGRMLDFARRPAREKEPTDVAEIVDKTLVLSRKYLQHSHIELEKELPPDLPPVLAIPGELRQVFLNLVLNAVDAMPEGGILRVGAWHNDGRLGIEFSDTGRGIRPEYQDRIFEPFFSTKEEGTGLGLSVSYNVVKRHGGEIAVTSEVGMGSTFVVWLPAMEGEGSDSASA